MTEIPPSPDTPDLPPPPEYFGRLHDLVQAELAMLFGSPKPDVVHHDEDEFWVIETCPTCGNFVLVKLTDDGPEKVAHFEDGFTLGEAQLVLRGVAVGYVEAIKEAVRIQERGGSIASEAVVTFNTGDTFSEPHKDDL